MFNLNEYSPEIEELFLQFLITDGELFARCRNIIQPDYFSNKYKDCVEFLLSYADEYSAVPSEQQIYATTRTKLEKLDKIQEDHEEWFLHEFEGFCRHKALIGAVLEAADLIEKKEYGPIENKIKDAIGIGLVKDLGTDYFAEPKDRLLRMKDKSGMVPTGWSDIDRKLFGGLNKGEITIFAGPSGAGKSLILQNLALNLTPRLNVVYITLELSEDLCSYRLDSMVSKYATRDIFKNLDDVDLKVRMFGKKSAGVRIKQMPSGATVNDVKSYIKELEIQTGRKVDAVMLDYLDLMMPVSKRIDPSNLFIKDKYVTEELRNFAVEKNIILASASQLNRSATEEVEYDHSHIGGGISKIQTADNVIGIFTSKIMRERGRYQLQFMKTRSSSGVGQKVDLKFCTETLRIEDLEDGEMGSEETVTKSIEEKLKRKNVVTKKEKDEEHVEKHNGEETTRLRQLIRKFE